MIPGDSIIQYLRFCLGKGLVRIGEFLRALGAAALYCLGRMSADASKSAAMRFRARYTPKELRQLDKSFVQHALLPLIYGDAKKQMAQHRREGKILLLVTASTENYMAFVADALGFDGLLATPISPDGTVTQNCKGEEKVRRVEAWLKERGLTADYASSYAYGDSKSDLPMLRLAGHAIQVNPKKKLRRAAPEMETVFWN